MNTKILSILILLFAVIGCSSDSDELEVNPDDPTAGNVVRPQSVDYFNINVTRDKWVHNTFYISTLKQYRLSVKEFSLVSYEWKSSDSNVLGIVVSQRNLDHLKDGVVYNDKQYKTYNANGSVKFGMDDHVTGAFTLYVKTFSSNYIYSNETKRVDVNIEPTRYYDVYSSSPYLN